MQHEYSGNVVTPWGGMKEMNILVDRTGISKKILELGLSKGNGNISIDSVVIVSIFLGETFFLPIKVVKYLYETCMRILKKKMVFFDAQF